MRVESIQWHSWHVHQMETNWINFRSLRGSNLSSCRDIEDGKLKRAGYAICLWFKELSIGEVVTSGNWWVFNENFKNLSNFVNFLSIFLIKNLKTSTFFYVTQLCHFSPSTSPSRLLFISLRSTAIILWVDFTPSSMNFHSLFLNRH